jgi:hypothetical protein
MPALSGSSTIVLALLVLCVSVVLNVLAFRALRRSSLLLHEQTAALQQVKGDIAELQEIADRVSHRAGEDSRLLARVAAELESVKSRSGSMSDQAIHGNRQVEHLMQEMRRALQSRDVAELLEAADRPVR